MVKLIFPLIFLIACFFSLQGESSLLAESKESPIVGQLVDPILLRGIEDVILEGNYVYLPCREGKRLTICSIKDSTRPKVISSFTHPKLSHAAGFAIHNNIVYLVSQSNQSLLVINITDRSTPKFLGSVVIGQAGKGILYKVAYRNGYCFVANQGEKTIFTVDVNNPAHPTVVGSVSVTKEDDGPFSLFLHGDFAYTGTIFGRHNRFAIIDIKKPTEPKLVKQLHGPEMGHLSGEVIDNFFIAVNWDKNTLFIFDVSNPANPLLHAKLVDNRLGSPNRCIVTKERAYLPMVNGHGVAVVDITNKQKPLFLTSIQKPIFKKTYGIALRDELLYVGAREGNSLVILNRLALEQ